MRNEAVKKAILPILGLSLVLGSSLVLATKSKEAEQVSGYSASSLPTTIDLNDTSAENIRSYYSSLNNLSESERKGTNLLKNLKTILKNGQKYYSYENGTSIWQMYEITDRDWDKSPATSISGYNSNNGIITGYTYGSSTSSKGTNPYVRALYNNRDVENGARAWDSHGERSNAWTIEREHVWPKSQGFESSGQGGARGDPMHLQAANGTANGMHSNLFYGYVDKSQTYKNAGSTHSSASGNLTGISLTMGSNTVFEPQDSDKGDIARAIFYMVARYNYLSGSDSDGINTNNPNLTLVQESQYYSSYTSSTSNPGKMGILTDLLAWHHADPVDSYEIHRNNLLYENFTNNRNPFIDFPEWVDFIWGTATYNGRKYQQYYSSPTGYATPSTDTINGYNSGGSSDPVSVTGVSLNVNSTSIAVGNSEILGATVLPNNATNQVVSWSSSNPNVATVSSSGRVTAVAEGNATITVTTSDGGYTATCNVAVTTSQGGGGSSTTTYDLYTSSLTEGDYVICSGTNALKNTASTSPRLNAETVTITDNKISNPDASLIWHISADSTDPSYWNFYNDSVDKYAAFTSANARATLISDITDYGRWSVAENTTYDFTNKGNTGKYLRYNAGYGFASYSNQTGVVLSLYKATEHSVPSSKTLDSISLDTSDADTEFNIGDTFNYNELVVTANYTDGSEDIVIPTSVSTPDMSTAGQPTVTVTYTEGGVTRTATYTITVNAVTLTSIDVSNEKTEYYVGDTFVKPTVTATYSNGSTSDVTNSATFSGYNLSNAGNQTVSVSYTNGTTVNTSYSITVTAVELSSISVSTVPTKTTYTEGEYFDPTGLVITRTYNNSSSDTYAYANHTSEFTFTPTTSTALSTSNTIVTISYGGKSTSQAITVNSSSGQNDEVTISSTMSQIVNANNYTISSSNTTTCYTSFSLDEVITISTTGAANCGSFWGTSPNIDWRLYRNKNGNIIVTASSGYELDSVTFTYSTSNSGQLTDPSGNQITSGNSNPISGLSSTFTVINTNDATNGQVRLTAISVTYHSTSSGGTDPVTSITASVSKSFYVGETISKSDITLKDNHNNTISSSNYSFADDGYQFTYADATSGGDATSKTFTNSITYLELTCSLTVNVSRESSSTPVSSTLEHTGSEFSSGGISATSYRTNQTATVDGIAFYVDGYIYNSKLSLSNGSKSAPGQVKNTSPYSSAISTVSVSGASPDIQLSTDGSTWVAYNSATPTTVDYYYFRLYYANTSVSSYVNITSITVSLKVDENPTNLSNYIMFEDTANQCTTKFSVAKNRFEQMSTSERAAFMTSDDYVISTARTRLQAWANHLGKTITYSNSDYVISNNNYLSLMLRTNGNSAISIIVVVSILGIGTIACYFFIKRRKPE